MSEEAKGKWVAGDVVCLKSGGPAMTVTGDRGDGNVDTNWMGFGQTHFECFPAASLRRARWFER